MREIPDFLRPGYVNVISKEEIESKKRLDAKYEEYFEKFGEYPEVSFMGDDDCLIKRLDMCIEYGQTFYEMFLADLDPDDDI